MLWPFFLSETQLDMAVAADDLVLLLAVGLFAQTWHVFYYRGIFQEEEESNTPIFTRSGCMCLHRDGRSTG